jgi:hypothetical protein
MKSIDLTSKLDAAKTALSKAEVDLAGAIREIRLEPKANKIVVSMALDDALEKVSDARSTLVELEALIREDAE